MDLNYLFHRQQVERSRAATAKSKAARDAHRNLAERYEMLIDKGSDGPALFARDDDDYDATTDEGAESFNAPLALAITAREVKAG